jgi:hypothetical protein
MLGLFSARKEKEKTKKNKKKKQTGKQKEKGKTGGLKKGCGIFPKPLKNQHNRIPLPIKWAGPCRSTS